MARIADSHPLPSDPAPGEGGDEKADAQTEATPDLDDLRRMMQGVPGLLDGVDEAPPDPLRPLPQMALTRGRVHEATGRSRRRLAALAAGAAQPEGQVMWLRPAWRIEALYPYGLLDLMPDPGALIIVACPKPVDILWCMEEALHAGCVSLVVAEIVGMPDLRQVRRLHLAAGEGLARNRRGGRVRPAPLGLMLDAERARSQVPGVESRWGLHPVPGPDSLSPVGRWRLERQLARGKPPRDWDILETRLPGGAPGRERG
ncbi:hypothetical protein C4N9_10960 [Pararhodobacter marinus]|uniref:Protein ImuA n=1 Tax=Pararhodobacter marinus TaxID=2184063 RepID=A0A2U2C9F8_9RHOB|nr:hypothetical protein [Pararhodobacter marinus]PWE28507.1 hypothetical protein C4N9_10960 [Pararhodobacter marinus]